jgi:hypothetical protein
MCLTSHCPVSIKEILSRSHHAAFASLDSLDSLLLLDATAFPFGQVVIMATQDRLNVLLKVFAELANLLFYAFFCFRLRHSVFTYLSDKALPKVSTLVSKNMQISAV